MRPLCAMRSLGPSILLFCTSLCLATPAKAVDHTYSVDWTGHYGGTARDSGQSCWALPDGSYLVHGYFEDRFNPEGDYINEPPNFDKRSLFMAKYGPDGELVWVKGAGSSHCDVGGEITGLADGTCAIVARYGYGGASIQFGFGEANSTYLSGFDHYDVCLAKFNADGRLQWARRCGGNGWDAGLHIGMSPDGGLYATGQFEQRAFFRLEGPEPRIELTTESGEPGSYTNFLLRYESDGAFGWVMPGAYGAVAALANGQCAVTVGGSVALVSPDGTEAWRCGLWPGAGYAGEVACLPGTSRFLVALTGTTDSPVQMWEAQPDGTAVPVWAAGLDGQALNSPVACVRECSGDSYVHDPYDGMLYRFDADGALTWSRYVGFGGSGVCAAPAADTVMMTGVTYGTVVIGAGMPGQTTITSRGSGDIWLAKLTTESLCTLYGTAEGEGHVIVEPCGRLPLGCEATFRAAPNHASRAEFVRWEGCLAAHTGPVVTVTVTEDMQAHAVFAMLDDPEPLPTAGPAAIALLALVFLTAAHMRMGRQGTA